MSKLSLSERPPGPQNTSKLCLAMASELDELLALELQFGDSPLAASGISGTTSTNAQYSSDEDDDGSLRRPKPRWQQQQQHFQQQQQQQQQQQASHVDSFSSQEEDSVIEAASSSGQRRDRPEVASPGLEWPSHEKPQKKKRRIDRQGKLPTNTNTLPQSSPSSKRRREGRESRGFREPELQVVSLLSPASSPPENDLSDYPDVVDDYEVELDSRPCSSSEEEEVREKSTTSNGDDLIIAARVMELTDRRASLNSELISLRKNISRDETKLLRLREALATHKQKLGVVERELSLVTDALAGAKSGENRKRAAVETHPWSKAARTALKKTFGLSDFREYQLEVINATMAKHDVFFVAPTGGGKSLTFMLPGILDGFARGFTLVISPLIALMQDQVAYLTRIGVRAAMLATGIPRADINAVHKVMVAEDDASNPLRFVFVTPERVGSSKMFNARLESAYRNHRLDRIAVDEAHCCSQDGHDYRPDYATLGKLKEKYPDVPLIALTATASSAVVADVEKDLSIQGCEFYRRDFNRPNLQYHVLPKSSSFQASVDEIADWIFTNNERHLNINRAGKISSPISGIIYTFSRKESEKVASGLSEKGIRAGFYHAELASDMRARVYDQWYRGEIQVVVATVSFGLGISKDNVRYVIHHTFSKNIESYYQESGRAGRDGLEADCVVFFRPTDVSRIMSLIYDSKHSNIQRKTNFSNLNKMILYCLEREQCRRAIIGAHLGYSGPALRDRAKLCNNMCDNCDGSATPHGHERFAIKVFPLADAILEVLSEVQRTQPAKSSRGRRSTADSSVTLLQLISAVKSHPEVGTRGTRPHVQVSGQERDPPRQAEKVAIPKEWNKDNLEMFCVFLFAVGMLEAKFSSTAYSTNVYVVGNPGLRSKVRTDHELFHFTCKPPSAKKASQTTEKKQRPRTASTEEPRSRASVAETIDLSSPDDPATKRYQSARSRSFTAPVQRNRAVEREDTIESSTELGEYSSDNAFDSDFV